MNDAAGVAADKQAVPTSASSFGMRWRWGILAFAVASVIINNFDRQMIAMLKPWILDEYGWGDIAYGRLAAVFQLGAVGTLLFAGWFLDKVGLRWGYAIGNGIWSGITLAHVFIASFGGFIALRAALGASESIQTPAAVKAVASYFPQKETSFALGIVNAAPNVGAIVVPLAIPAMALAFGWRESFLIVGGAGLLWVIVWLVLRPPAPPAEARITEMEARDERWSALLKDRRVHGFMVAKVLTDQMWWLMMFWLPDFFMRSFDLSPAEVARPTAFVYVLAMLGALSSGLVAGRLIAGGTPANRARMQVLVGYGTLALVAPLALFVGNLWLAALVIGIVLFAHQGFSTNLFATVIDVFPARRVASVISIGALAGNLWGAAMLELTGQILAAGGSYLPLFVAGGAGYLLSTFFIARWILR